MNPVQYLDIPLDQLHDSPTQPRMVYDDAYIAELGADIKSHGRNLSPLLVRPRVPELFKGLDDPHAAAGYEIVFGHCRKRAIAHAGLPTARCEVRDMTDQEVERAQISENLQRKNVHPFEEAAGYQALIDRHGDTADAIAERTGKSRSYIYGRLKLLQACEEIRKACVAGEIDAEVALLIARLRTDKLQSKALARIKAKYWSIQDGGKASYRQIRDLLKEEFTLNLKIAIFDVTDAALLPGAGACTSCPKRSANAPEFEDLLQTRKAAWGGQAAGDPNLCTDPDCFAAKKAAHLKAEATALQKKHGASKLVIDGNKARNAVGADGTVKGGYLPLSKDVRAQIDAGRKIAQSNAKLPPPQIVVIQNPRDGKLVEAVKESDLVALGVRKSSPKAVDARAAQQQRDREEERRRQEQTKKTNDMHLELLQRVRAAAKARPRDAADLLLVTTTALQGVGHRDKDLLARLWDAPSFEALTKRVGSMPAPDIEQLLMDCALVEGAAVTPWSLDSKPKNMLATAKRYGVSLAPPAAEPAPAPSTAARAPSGGAAKASTAKAAAVRYRDAATGQTWSGKGLQPAWLKAAIQAGAKLDDFDVNATQVIGQAGSAGKDDEGAGSAGVSSPTTPAAAGEVAATQGQLEEVAP